jgi:putative acetyltransferase
MRYGNYECMAFTKDMIAIYEDHAGGDEAKELIRQLDEELLWRYPALQGVHGLRLQDFADPNFTFLIAQIDGSAVGCGALRVVSPKVGEVKRMFVLSQFRRRGIARKILAALETRALKLGHEVVLLETGDAQPEAVSLYTSVGYRQTPNYGEYIGNPFSRCFEKRLG